MPNCSQHGKEVTEGSFRSFAKDRVVRSWPEFGNQKQITINYYVEGLGKIKEHSSSVNNWITARRRHLLTW